MPEQLKELMTRLAEEAGPVPSDPLMWQRARRSRRRDRFRVATAIAATGLIVTGIGVLGTDALRDTAPPAAAPGEQGEPGIPSDVHDPIGDGGLELERDLAVGRASVAIGNDTAAFVITADDGAYHRLHLPGFDPELYDAGGTEVSGLSLSPDGTKIIYGWQGDPEDPEASGARLVDLLTGEVVTMSRQALYDEPARLLPWGFSWSPDGRFVVNRVKIADADDPWASGPHWAQGLDTESGEPIGFTERTAGLELPEGDDLASTGRIASSGFEVRGFMNGLMLWSESSGRALDLPDDEVWVTGRFDATSTRLLVEPDRIAGSLLLVEGLSDDVATSRRDPKITLLRMTDGPADVELLGWVGPEHALAILDQDFDDESAQLVLLSLDVEAGEADGTVVGDVSVADDGLDLSFATDLASVKSPTRDFPGDPVKAGDDAGQSAGPATIALVGVGAATLALAGALVVAVRRRRSGAWPT
jgi:hypothetical protein